MSFRAESETAFWRACASVVGLAALVWLVITLCEEHDPASPDMLTSRSKGVGSRPGLRGQWRRTGDVSPMEAVEDHGAETDDSATWRDVPPPAVFVQQAAHPPPPTALRIRVILPWGELPHRELGCAKRAASGADGPLWELGSDDPDEDEGGELAEARWGRFDPDGHGSLSAADLSLWGRWPLRVTAPHCGETVVGSPPSPLPETFVIRLAPDGGTVRYRGCIRDARGRPLEDAGVFLEDAEWQAGARTASDGTFDLLVPAEMGLRDGDRGACTPLLAVAPGFLASTYRAHPAGEQGICLALDPDTVHVRLELRFLRENGSPAGGARAWLYPASQSFREGIETARSEPDTAEAATRRFLPRVAGGASVDEQGFEAVQDGTLLLDLVADETGVLILPALLPGTWRLRAALGRRTVSNAASGQPEIYEIRVQELADMTLEVPASSPLTRATVHLRSGRSVVGTIDVAANLAWHCEHEEHVHWVRVDDWVWAQVKVRSGRREWADEVHTYSGRFRLDGLPPGACKLVVHTFGHPDVMIELPASEPSGSEVVDIAAVRVPDARIMPVHLVGLDGAPPADWKGEVQLLGAPGAQGPWRSGGARFRFVLPSAPQPTAAIVVRQAGRTEPAAVAHGPFRFTGDEPIVVRVPESASRSGD